MLLLTFGLLLAQEPAVPDAWSVLRPERLVSSAGSALELRADGSIFVRSAAAATDVYEVECVVPFSGIVALRLEALPDPALPLGGASHAANSNLCVTEIEVDAGPAGGGRRKPARVPFRAVHQVRGDAGTGRRLIDGNLSSFWVVHGTTGDPSVAVLLAETPFGFEAGTTLTIRIRQESRWGQHTLGRFRLAVTESQAAADAYAPQLGPLALRVDTATWNGIQFLLNRQHPDGTFMNWMEVHHYAGTVSLCGYALYKAGVPRDHAAIQLALSYLETHPPEWTYDAALRILWYTSMDPAQYAAQIEEAAEILLFTPELYFQYQYAAGMGAGGDLSNHQFGVVALHALDESGFKLDPKLWRRLSEKILATQKPDGSWGYVPDGGATPTMSLAGLAVAAACRNALERNGAPKKDLDVMQKCVERGINYCGENFLLDQARDVGPLDRWFWYACYGMERSAALARVDQFGKHDWYAEVADQLCNEQGGDGAWSTPWGEPEVTTAFCLLTLARATAATGMPSIAARFAPRWSSAGTEADLTITAVGAPEVQVYLAGIGKKALKDFSWPGDARPRIVEVQWLLNGQPAGDPVRASGEPADVARAGSTPRFAAHLSLPGNGDFQLQAVARVIPPQGTADELEEFASAPLTLTVRGLVDPPRRFEIDAMHREAWPIRPDLRESSCSTTQDAGRCGADKAFDRAQSTRWSCLPDDPEPWIRAEFRRGVQVKAIRLLPVLDQGRLSDGLGMDVPRRVRLLLNDREEILLDFGPEDMLRGKLVEFDKKLMLRRIEVRILQRDPGVIHPGYAGWREIQLLVP
jgi:hypothetical protein